MDPHQAQAHWDKIYRTKQPHEVSWTQVVPATSLAFIHSFNLPKSAQVMDISGGHDQSASSISFTGMRYL